MKKINFKFRDKYYYKLNTRPKPAKNYLPEWWKNTWTYGIVEKDTKLRMVNGSTNVTMKKCQPLLDGMTHGYILETQYDYIIDQAPNNPDGFTLSWKVDEPVFQKHGQHSMNMETPPGYHKQPVKFIWNMIPRTPKGYSLLFIQPMGHNDLPFKAIPAIVDADDDMTNYTIPGWISDHHEGIIPAGTPVVQLIPIKRDDWEATFSYFEEDEHDILDKRTFRANILNNYVNRIWKKKKFI